MKVKNISFLLLLALLNSCMNNGRTTLSTSMIEKVDSLWYPMDSIPVDSDEVHICVSEDGNMKFYSWNTGMGGTCPDFAVLCQYRTKEGKPTIEDMCIKEGEPAWVSNVHSIKKDDGTTYYITTRSHRASSNDGYMWMDAFTIDHDTLKNVSVLNGGDDLDECGLEINYVISDWYYRTNGDGWDWMFEYDVESKNLYVPIVVLIDEAIPVISDRYRLYHFDGMEFVAKGESPHKGLHASLKDYSWLAKYFRTKNYIVRIDKLENGPYRYASWNSPAGISEKPDLTVIGGTFDEEKDCYTFINDGVEYIVGYCEDKPISGGIFEHHEYLLVRKNGKTLLKEERVSNTE